MHWCDLSTDFGHDASTSVHLRNHGQEEYSGAVVVGADVRRILRGCYRRLFRG